MGACTRDGPEHEHQWSGLRQGGQFRHRATIIGGVLLMIAAYKNWRMLWNWFGRFLRSSLGEKSARVALGLIGGAFAAGGL